MGRTRCQLGLEGSRSNPKPLSGFLRLKFSLSLNSSFCFSFVFQVFQRVNENGSGTALESSPVHFSNSPLLLRESPHKSLFIPSIYPHFPYLSPDSLPQMCMSSPFPLLMALILLDLALVPPLGLCLGYLHFPPNFPPYCPSLFPFLLHFQLYSFT